MKQALIEAELIEAELGRSGEMWWAILDPMVQTLY
jgi:hypothetical protein